MGYLLTQDQLDLQALARTFADKEIRPISKEFDRSGEFPMATFKKAAELGFTTLSLPEKMGGLGINNLTNAIIREELAKGDAGLTVSIGTCNMLNYAMQLAGTETQYKKYAEVLLGGGLASFALTEAEAGSDAAACRTTANKIGNDYIINGAKCFITNAGIAGIYLVFATIDRSLGAKGITAFLVERDREGVSAGKEEDKMGLRLSNTAEVVFTDVKVPEENRVGAEGKGFLLAMQTLMRSRPASGASAIGLCQSAIDHAVKYSKERVTFGRPICKNQGIQFMLADMEIQTQAARQMVYNASRLADEGIYDARVGQATKTFVADTAMKVTTDAVQIFGGYGYSREYPVEKLMRDAKIYQIFEGTNQIQRMLIAGDLLK